MVPMLFSCLSRCLTSIVVYGTSLHKWLGTTWVRYAICKKEKIDQIWPLFAERDLEPNDMRRLNHIGTHPVHTDLAI